MTICFHRNILRDTGLLTFGCIVLASSTNAQDANWKQFRGAHSSGVAPSQQVVMDLDIEQNLRWRTETSDTGWSSPLTDGKTIWVTSAKLHDVTSGDDGVKPDPGRGGGLRIVAGSVSLFAEAFDASSGVSIHRIELATIDSPDTLNILNSYASPTGVWCGQRIVMHFGLYGTFCLDSDSGKVLWRQRLVYDDNIGPGSSIKCADGVVVVPCDGMAEQFVAGLSLQTGEELWRTARPPVEAREKEFRSSYSTPLIVEVDGRNLAIVPGTYWCIAYHVASGQEVWRLRHGKGFSVSATPIEVDGKVIISTSYGGKELVAIDPTGTGDVTETHVLWRQSKGVTMMPSPVRVGERLFTVDDKGIAHALNHEDGELIWRARVGGNFASSPLASGDRMIVGDREGTVTVFQAGEEYQQIAQYELGERIMASFVSIEDDLIVRTEKALYRFSNKISGPGN